MADHPPAVTARRSPAERWDVLLAIAVGGALGSLARYQLSVAFPHARGEFALSTLLCNVVGCLLIGVLMAVITGAPGPHRLLRPFLGVGVLGGFTTFSTYVVDAIDSAATGHPRIAVLYALGTVAASLVSVLLGLAPTRALLERANTGRQAP
ncbi:fluoride efflux transporter CrcB [Amycolatopsis anabasis]|uniref:fluoride efflux transporter CrcB n=1 Tax=Amycolatopsis anabasis TaxID=1840409 RepID=UPI00131CBDE5|nr:fluoride efflux transporter CrcB [Amycolatopsis anabasis]